MSKIRTAYKIGKQAYKLGKRNRGAVARARSGLKSLQKAQRLGNFSLKARAYNKSLTSSSLKNVAKSPFSFNKSKRVTNFEKGLTQGSSAFRYRLISEKAAKTALAQRRRGVSLTAGLRASNKINKMGGLAKAAYVAGGIRKRTVAATAGVAFGANSLRGKKRKPMSAATKAKISRALKGRKRK